MNAKAINKMMGGRLNMYFNFNEIIDSFMYLMCLWRGS